MSPVITVFPLYSVLWKNNETTKGILYFCLKVMLSWLMIRYISTDAVCVCVCVFVFVRMYFPGFLCLCAVNNASALCSNSLIVIYPKLVLKYPKIFLFSFFHIWLISSKIQVESKNEWSP